MNARRESFGDVRLTQPDELSSMTQSRAEPRAEILEQLKAFQDIDREFTPDPPLGSLGDYTLRHHVINAKVHLQVCVDVLISEEKMKALYPKAHKGLRKRGQSPDVQ